MTYIMILQGCGIMDLLKYLDCDYEETFYFDMLAVTMEFDDSDYPELYCPKCSDGTLVPKDIYNIKNKK